MPRIEPGAAGCKERELSIVHCSPQALKTVGRPNVVAAIVAWAQLYRRKGAVFYMFFTCNHQLSNLVYIKGNNNRLVFYYCCSSPLRNSNMLGSIVGMVFNFVFFISNAKEESNYNLDVRHELSSSLQLWVLHIFSFADNDNRIIVTTILIEISVQLP